MASNLKKFNRNVLGASNKIFDYMPDISPSGDVKRLSEIDVIINSWKNILLTPVGSYDHNPEYGSILYQLLFEPADNITIDKIKTELESKLMLYDDRAKIMSTDVKYISSNKKGFNIDIDVLYKGNQKNMSVSITEEGMVK